MTDLLISIGAVIVAAALAYLGGQRQGKANEKAKRDAETLERLERGREAVGHGRNSGATPDERLRLNDSQW
jgi:fructose-1,6-bisphosphatase/sedoheptulose 1,7-bisphosphatase-like protein